MENAEVYITSKEQKTRRSFGEVIIYNLVFNPFPLGLDFPFITLSFQDY